MLKERPVNFKNTLKGAMGLLPHVPQLIKGGIALATAKPESHKSLGSLLEDQAQKTPNHAALLFEGQRYSYSEMNGEANRYSRVLMDRGIKSGDVVAVLLENRPETLFAVAGIAKLGAIAAMINSNQDGDVLVHSLSLVKPKACIVGAERRKAYQDIADQIDSVEDLPLFLPLTGKERTPAAFDNMEKLLDAASTANPPTTASVQMQDPCFYIYTSGTTGLPKASIMTHQRWVLAGIGMGNSMLRLQSDDVFYCCLPLYHNNGLSVSWASVLGTGATLALAKKFSASNFWKDIDRHGATSFCYIGELCRYLLNQPEQPSDNQHGVRMVVGNGLRPDVWMEFKERFAIEHIAEFYGASEGTLAFVNMFNLDKTAGYCPLPYAIVDVDTVTEEPSRNNKGWMTKVKRGSIGLLITEVTERTPYYGYTDDEASAKKLFHGVFKKGDCWFNTGDLVKDQGFKHIAFADRLGDTFRWKGENVSTTQVEAVANSHPQVEDAVVYGVAIPGTDGKAGMASITPNVALNDLDIENLGNLLQDKLAKYALPVFIRLRPTQDVTGTFKHQKAQLKKEGFNIDIVDEPIFVMRPGSGRYELLKDELYTEIEAGKIGF